MLPNGIAPNVLPLTSDSTMRLPVVDAWNFTLEHQFTPSTVLSVGYVGNKGYHVTPGGTNYNINQPTIVGFGTLSTNQRRLFLPEVRLDAEHQVLQRRRQREVQLAAGARREALRRAACMFQGNFTWASAFDFANDYFFWNHDIDYGRENGVRRFVFNFNSVYELPFGKGRQFLKNASRPVDLCSAAGRSPGSGPGSRAFRSRRAIVELRQRRGHRSVPRQPGRQCQRRPIRAQQAGT